MKYLIMILVVVFGTLVAIGCASHPTDKGGSSTRPSTTTHTQGSVHKAVQGTLTATGVMAVGGLVGGVVCLMFGLTEKKTAVTMIFASGVILALSLVLDNKEWLLETAMWTVLIGAFLYEILSHLKDIKAALVGAKAQVSSVIGS